MKRLSILKKHTKEAYFILFALCFFAAPIYADEDIYQLANFTIDNRSESELLIFNLVDDDDIVEVAASQLANNAFQLSTPVKKMLSSPLPYRDEVLHAAKQTQLDVDLIDAVIAVESGYNANAVSKKGAIGLMQVMPQTAQSLVANEIKPKSAKQQVLLGALYLQKMLGLFEGNLSLALAAYNAGPQAVKKHHGNIPPYQETQRYVPKVLAYYQFLKHQKNISFNHH